MKKIYLLFLMAVLLIAFQPTASYSQACDYAVSFPGFNSYVDCGAASGYQAKNQVTVQAWVNLTNSQTNQKIAGNIDPFTNSGFELGVKLGSLYCEVKDTVGLHEFVAGTVPSNEWVHLAFTYAVGGRFRGYINGIMVVDSPATSFPIGDNGTTNFYIGAAPWDPNYFVASGLIDEVRVYDIARTVNAIRRDMRLCLPGNTGGLIGYWRFAEGTGATVADLSGSLHTGTFSGTSLPTWQATDGPYGTGVSDLQMPTTLGYTYFNPTALDMDITLLPSNDTIVVTHLDCEPGGVLPTGSTTYNNGYWVADKYGSGSPAFNAIFNMPPGTISSADEAQPSNLRLYFRPANSTGSWSLSGFASSALSFNSYMTFSNVLQFGQYKIGTIGSSTLEVDDVNGDRSVVISPNPSTGNIVLNSAGSPIKNVTVYDVQGRVVSQWIAESTTLRQTSLNLDALQSGCYTVHVMTTTGLTVRKIVVSD